MNVPVTYGDGSQKLFGKNPAELKNIVNKLVKVYCQSNYVEGTVYTVDPVSEMIVLLVRDANTGNSDMHLILRKHIESIEVIGQSSFPITNDLFDKSNKDLSLEEKTERCDKLMKWLQANLLPIVKEGEVLTLPGVLTIHPPYEFENCVCKNVIVLERIQKLILAMKDL